MSLPHDSAETHVTGRSEYVDDRPFTQGELHVGVVFSPHAHAKIENIDVTEAKKVPGVVGVFTAKDLHHNRWGTIFQDQPLLAEGEVQFAGESVAIVAATSRFALTEGKAKVAVSYKKRPAILSIEEAKQQKLFIGYPRVIERGDVHQAFAAAPLKKKGKVVIRGADHFYLESQVSIAYPKEQDQIEIHTSSQHPTEVQHVVAHALGLADKDVVCIVKRMGGGFGGKESQGAPYAAYAALVAKHFQRAARIVLSKDEDMIATGKRNPFECSYEVGFDTDGFIHSLLAELYSDGGAYADLSTAIMERAMLHCDNAYYIPNIKIRGQVCRTHFHPHTAFRGFGGPKGVAMIEHIIEEIAHTVHKDSLEIRKLNCYTEKRGRDIAPYGQTIENNCLPALFSQLESDSNYHDRRREIDSHNERALQGNEKTLRGLSLTAVKFGISFTTRFLNQANALVLVHRDGSLQVSTGATEMGQGVNARIAQVVAEELGLPRSWVRVMPARTDRNANTSPTAASSGTDLNAAAALIATKKIRARLSELARRVLELPQDRWAKNTAALGTENEISVTGKEDPEVSFSNGVVISRHFPDKKISFPDLVNEAYLNRISLSDYGYFKYPNLSFNKMTGQGRAFHYYTQGVAASEVSLDRSSGETKVQRVDILMDLGVPINEALDLGQVYGGFVQGMGWVTSENLVYSDSGLLLSHSPSTYKIPNVQDTPRKFTAKLFPNPHNTLNLRGTKAVGEPPLLLSLSVWTAIQDALRYLPHFKERFPSIQIPATPEEILRHISPEHFRKWDNQP